MAFCASSKSSFFTRHVMKDFDFFVEDGLGGLYSKK
jgi:hypothetical protein